MGNERNSASRADRLTFSVGEAAHLLGISRGLAYEQVRLGKLPVIRFGRRLLVPRVALERMLAQCHDASIAESK